MKRQERGPFLTDPATVVRVARDSHASRIVGLGCVTIAPVPARWQTEDLWAAIWRHYGNARHHWRDRAEAIAWTNPYDRFYVENALFAYVAGNPDGRGQDPRTPSRRP